MNDFPVLTAIVNRERTNCTIDMSHIQHIAEGIRKGKNTPTRKSFYNWIVGWVWQDGLSWHGAKGYLD